MILSCKKEDCKYSWDYNGKGKFYTTCPRCLNKVKIIKKLPTTQPKPSVIRQLLETQENRCNRCKKKLNHRHEFNVDHIIPKGQGGLNLLSNMQILCLNCHGKKNKKEGRGGTKLKYYTKYCKFCKKILFSSDKAGVNLLLDWHISTKHKEYYRKWKKDGK